MQVLTRLGESSVGNLSNQVGTAADRGEEAVEHRLLRLVAHRHQRANQRRQRQLALACERFGVVRVPRNLREFIRGNSLGEFQCQILYEFTVTFTAIFYTFSRDILSKIANKSTTYGVF